MLIGASTGFLKFSQPGGGCGPGQKNTWSGTECPKFCM